VGEVGVVRCVEDAGVPLLDDHVVVLLLADLLDDAADFLEHLLEQHAFLLLQLFLIVVGGPRGVAALALELLLLLAPRVGRHQGALLLELVPELLQLHRAPIEIEPVVYADRAERRYPADTAAGGLTKFGQIELGLEAVNIADVEERGQPDVEGQRDEVLDVAEDLAGATDAGAELVRRRNLPRLEGADRVGSTEEEALEHRQPLVAKAE